jgi:HAD superfamily hydrolase (TIGR01450 family)
MSLPATISTAQLIASYSVLLLDAYGVLLDKSGPLPGAKRFIEQLNHSTTRYLILTNSASRLPETMASEFADHGFDIPAERILTSGMLLRPYFARHHLVGNRCVVLGTDDSICYTNLAGGKVISLDQNTDAEVVIIADQKGFPCMQSMNHVLSLIIRRLDAERPVHLVLCNPDIIYPVSTHCYGFTAGGLAAMLEAILVQRYPDQIRKFERLGKPFSPIFEEARRRSGTHDMVMIGDQLETDILGANRFGIDSVLVETGLARQQWKNATSIRPTWHLKNLAI